MMNDKVISIVDTARDNLIEVIKEVLLKEGPKKIHVELPNTWDEDRYYMEILTEVRFDDDGFVCVVCTTDHEDAETYTEEIELYSLDEIIKIIDGIDREPSSAPDISEEDRNIMTDLETF